MSSKKRLFKLTGWFICSIGAIFYCYEYLLRIEPSVMVSQIMDHLDIMATGFGIIIASYYYAYTPMQLIVGVLIDRYGSKLMLGIGIIACASGSLLFGISTSAIIAGIARFLIGFGSAFAFVGVLKLGAEWLPKKYFAMFAGLTTALGMLGGMVGDIFLSSLTHKIGWQSVIHIGTVFGIILVPIIFLFIHDTPKEIHKPEKTKRSFKKTYLGMKRMIRNPQMWFCGLIGGSLYLSLSAFAELWGIKFLQSVYSLDSEQSSFACSMVFLGWLIGGPISGWLSDHIKSRKKPLIIGGFLSATTITAIIFNPITDFYLLCGLLLLFGTFSSVEVICFAVSKESNPHHVAATALAFTNFLVMVGGIVFQPLIGILLDLFWSGGISGDIRIYSSFEYRLVFLAIPISLLIGVFLSSILKETLKKEKKLSR